MSDCSGCEFGSICKYRSSTELYLKNVVDDSQMPDRMQMSITCKMMSFGDPEQFIRRREIPLLSYIFSFYSIERLKNKEKIKL